MSAAKPHWPKIDQLGLIRKRAIDERYGLTSWCANCSLYDLNCLFRKAERLVSHAPREGECMSSMSMDLSPQVDVNDDLLAQRIRSHIVTKHRVAEQRLMVEVSDNVATLRGWAPSYYQRQLWLTDAKSFKEVEQIVDLIEVA